MKNIPQDLTAFGVTEDDLVAVRMLARSAGISTAEYTRNMLCGLGFEIEAVTLDGVTAHTPDYSAELAALLDAEGQGDAL